MENDKTPIYTRTGCPRPGAISDQSETAPISAYLIPLSIFQPAKTRDFLTGGNIDVSFSD
jgi:hypothetical protein